MYRELEPVLESGIEGNMERDIAVTREHPELVDKLGHSPLNEDDRVCLCMCVCIEKELSKII